MSEFQQVNASEWQEMKAYRWQLDRIEYLAERLPIKIRDFENLIGKRLGELNRQEAQQAIDKLVHMRVEKARNRELAPSRESLEGLERKFRKVGNVRIKSY